MSGSSMMLSGVEVDAAVRESTIFPDGEMVELVLLLSAGRSAALEAAAQQRGVTVAQLIRRLIRDFLDQSGGAQFPDWG